MTDAQTTNHPLVTYLESLARREDRATLATLRASLREGHALEALRVVLPFLSPDAGSRAEDDAVLFAGLFALHPESASRSLPAALRSLATGRDSENDSLEKRFMALLAADRLDLPTHLRHAVSLVGASGIGIDWDDLYQAVRYWEHEDDFIRRRWARAFWGNRKEEKETTADEPATA